MLVEKIRNLGIDFGCSHPVGVDPGGQQSFVKNCLIISEPGTKMLGTELPHDQLKGVGMYYISFPSTAQARENRKELVRSFHHDFEEQRSDKIRQYEGTTEKENQLSLPFSTFPFSGLYE